MSFISLRQLTLYLWYYQSWYCRLSHGFCSETQTDYFSEFIPATVLTTSRFWRLQKIFFTIHFISLCFLCFQISKLLLLVTTASIPSSLACPYNIYARNAQGHRSCLRPHLQWVHTLPDRWWSGAPLTCPMSYLVFKLLKLYWWRMNLNPFSPAKAKHHSIWMLFWTHWTS